MKKLILLALLVATSLLSVDQKIVHVYKNIPLHDECLQLVIVRDGECNEHYREFEIHDIAVFKSCKYECVFLMRFNRKTHECEVTIGSYEKHFDFHTFKKIMDSVFLYN